MPVLPQQPSHSPCRIALVGQAPGAKEVEEGRPFVGPAGVELNEQLRIAGIDRSDLYITNVFWERPPGDRLIEWCGGRSELPSDYNLPPIMTAGNVEKYVLPRFLAHNAHQSILERLTEELREVKPNLVVALGDSACWALLGRTGIGHLRGFIVESSLIPGLKVLPVFHPAAILRRWKNRVLSLIDWLKAAVEAEFPEIRRTARRVLINPKLEEIGLFYQDDVDGWGNYRDSQSPIAFDLETKGFSRITTIGFAVNAELAIVVPFELEDKTRYWSAADEKEVWWNVRRILQHPRPKVAHNGLYDIQFLLKAGIVPRNVLHDTMLLHHSLLPEMPKGLGVLASIYCNEAGWKLMVRHSEEMEK